MWEKTFHFTSIDSDNMTESEFKELFVQTALWCIPRISTHWEHDALHSLELLPKNDDSLVDNAYIEQVIARRSQQLGQYESVNLTQNSEIMESRLLICDYSATDTLEYYEGFSERCLDTLDVPPWDTWIAVFPNRDVPRPWVGYLVSLVPKSLIKGAQFDIDINPIDVLYWANSIYNEDEWLNRKLRDQLPKWLLEWTPAANL